MSKAQENLESMVSEKVNGLCGTLRFSFENKLHSTFIEIIIYGRLY